ncbi:MAG: heme lyase CcmF/NrfE family subunit [Ignavibacteria bacterium]
MFGKILMYVAFASSLLAIAFFYYSEKDKANLLKYGRLFYHISSISVIVASVFLLYLILTHQFQYTYVYSYSDTQLQTPLLISTFYAGQEGSFLLWTLWTVITGIFLLNYVSKGNRLEAPVMAIFTLVVAFLTFILILKSPFRYIWEDYPNDVKVGFMPEDGRGLNPLLQNFWMSIHPPTLFLGFALMSVPFAFAIGALVNNKKYNEWINYALPWLLLGSVILGIGIMMGGYWAYGVLGWGGYWGWDPVENSSLVPWIVSVVLIHTALMQRKTGGYKKTNLILSILTYVLVLYSTFLTRSGVLGESSVHSFVDPGNEVYLALVVFISSFIIISIVAVAFRFKHLKSEKKDRPPLMSKETFFVFGTIALSLTALFVLAGTSWPLIAKGSVQPDFYNKMNLPLAIIILLSMALSLYLEWKNFDRQKYLVNIGLPVILAVISTIILIFIGVQDIVFIIFSFASLLALFVNLIFAVRLIRKKSIGFGGALTHVGIALFFLGVIGSGRYSVEVPNLKLPRNIPVEALGYKLTYTGYESYMDANNKNDSSYYINIAVEQGRDSITLRPTFHPPSKFASSSDFIKNPDIASFPTKDLYIAALGVEVPPLYDDNELVELKKGETKKFKDFDIKFVDFDFGNIQKGGSEMMSGNFKIAAILEVSDGKKTETLKTYKISHGGSEDYQTAMHSNHPGIEFYFVSMNVKDDKSGGSTAVIAVANTSNKNQTESIIVSVSLKPFINVLWSGVLILFVGYIVAMIKRRKEILWNTNNK